MNMETARGCEFIALANTPTAISTTPALLLPHLPVDALATVKKNASDFQEVIKNHFSAFDLEIDQTVNCASKWSLEEAAKDVKIVRSAFPHVAHQHGTVAAAASWFRLLCSYDDLAESLDATAAVAMMAEITTALTHDDGESKPRRDSGTWAARPTLPTQWTEDFLCRLRLWLAENVVRNIKQDLNHYCAAIAREAMLREEAQRIGPPTYLSLRTQTIGLQPFFSIIAGVLCPTPQEQIMHDLRRDFHEAVSIAIGLQNDLVGLRREIAFGQTFNLALILEQQGHSLQTSIDGVVDCHNEAVSCAVQMAAEIISQDSSHAQYAASILSFVRTHYAWSSASSRYRTGFQDHQVPVLASRIAKS